ncbi:TonB-dependent receptor [Pontibacter sp. G13]|uniref:TonB-dependent receptor n=1 Tax=Pontibacter sp. G13 TaxID=3074898 RepID=UPI0028895E3C|nr:TonB-dependent receptor [Pontibacter sp. G13]WNJ20544.1 TonB-dependent receptor [Pontibacter sp. G13]
MMFRMVLLLGGLTVCLSGFSQDIRVLDPEKAPIPYAKVVWSDGDGAPLDATLTDLDGRATRSQQADIAAEHVRVSHLGFQSVQIGRIGQGDHTLILKPDPTQTDPVVITAQHGAGQAEAAVHRIQVMDRDQLDAMGAVNLQDALKVSLNTRISQDPVLGSGVSIMGLSGQHVNILIDGVPVTGRLDGNIDLSQINLQNIERIEIVEGPLSAEYGSNALAGTIHLITKKGTKQGHQIAASSYYESVGQYNLDGRLSLNRGNHQLTLTGGRNYFDGWDPVDPFFEIPEKKQADTNRAKSWNPKEQIMARAQYRYRTDQWEIRPYVDVFAEEILNRGMPRAPYHEAAFDDRYWTDRLMAGWELAGEIGQSSKLEIQASFQGYRRQKHTYLKDLTTLVTTLTENPSDHDTSRISQFMSRGMWSWKSDSARLSLQAGYHIQHETFFGVRVEEGSQEMGDYAAFGSGEWNPIQPLVIRLGLRYAYNTQYGAPVIPSAQMRYRWELPGGSSLTTRAAYAKGFRAPTLKELYFEFVDANHNILGNEGLSAEYSQHLNVFGSWKQIRGNHLFKLEIGGAYNHVQDRISLALKPGTTEYTYFNVGDLKSFALQGNATWKTQRWEWTLGGSYVGRKQLLDEEDRALPVAYTPEMRINAQYAIPWGGAKISLFYKYTGVTPSYQLDTNNEVEITEAADYHMLDVTCTKPFWGNRITWTFGGKNLLDVQNITSNAPSGGAHSGGGGSIPVSWGRTLFTQLSLQISGS